LFHAKGLNLPWRSAPDSYTSAMRLLPSIFFFAFTLFVLYPANAAEPPRTVEGFGSTPENNPYFEEGWVPRELIPPEFIDELVPAVCQGTYLPIFDEYGESDELNILANTVTVNKMKHSTLLGNVEGVARGMRFFSNQAQVDRVNNFVHLEGNVRFYQADIALRGNEGTLNTATGEFTLDKVQYVRGTSRTRIRTNLLSRDHSGVFHLEDASYTTCEPGRTDWRVYGNRLHLDYVEGWGTVMHAIIYVREIPVFYFPWFRFPLDDRRHTGLLVPRVASNQKNGFTLTQPLYINLAPHYDLTLTPTHYDIRGTHLGTQGRLLTSYGENALTYGYINDKEFGDDRNQVGFRHDGGYNLPWRSTADYRKVSDPAYYNDLDFSLISSNTNLLDQYGEIGLVRGPLRATFGSYDYQPLQGYGGRIYARVPGANVTFTRRSGIYGLDLVGSYNYFEPRRLTPYTSADRADGTALKGERQHAIVTPGLYFRDAFGRLELFTRHRYTDYELEDAGTRETQQSYAVHSGVVRGNLVFDRQASFSGNPFTQTLEIDAMLLNTDEVDQTEAPNFTTGEPRFTYASVFALDRFNGEDKAGDARQLSYGLGTSVLDANDIGIFRFQVGQIYYDKQREITLSPNNTSLSESIRYTREFSPLAIRTSMTQPRNFRLTNDLVWDQRIARNLLNSWTFNKTLGSRSFFTLGYNLLANEITHERDSEVETEQLNASGVVQLTSHLAFFGRSFFDRQKSEFIERLSGIEYESCCWRFTLGQFNRTNFSEDGFPTETGLFIQFHLKGLVGSESSQGEIDLGNIDEALEKAIPGYTSRQLYLPD